VRAAVVVAVLELLQTPVVLGCVSFKSALPGVGVCFCLVITFLVVGAVIGASLSIFCGVGVGLVPTGAGFGGGEPCVGGEAAGPDLGTLFGLFLLFFIFLQHWTLQYGCGFV